MIDVKPRRPCMLSRMSWSQSCQKWFNAAALGYAITSRRLDEVYNDQPKNKYLNATVIRPARSSRKLVEVSTVETLYPSVITNVAYNCYISAVTH